MKNVLAAEKSPAGAGRMLAAHSHRLLGVQHHFVKPHRVEPWLLPGEKVASGIPRVAFPQQLMEGCDSGGKERHRRPRPGNL